MKKVLLIAVLLASCCIEVPEELTLSGGNGYFDVIGKRMQAIGNESSVEFWSMPMCIFKDYSIDKDLSALIKKPWSVIRKGEALMEEIFIPVSEEGCVIIYSSDEPCRVNVSVTPILEYSWPEYSPDVWSQYTPDLASIDASIEGEKVVFRSGDKEGIIGGTGISVINNTSLSFEINGRDDKVIRIATNEKTYEALKDWKALRSEAEEYYEKFLDSMTTIETPDSELNEAYLWNLIALENFYLEKPEAGWVAGYNVDASRNGRPGFAWYFGRDFLWMSFAIITYGDFFKAKEGFRLLQRYQRSDGKIMHELTSAIGEIGKERWESEFPYYFASADSTPLYLIALDYYLKCSGDEDFIYESGDSIIRAFRYLLTTDVDGDAFIDNIAGHGWVEGGYLARNQTRAGHTTLYLASIWLESLKCAKDLFDLLGEERLSAQCEDLTTRIDIYRFWNESEGYFYHRKLPDGTFGIEKTVMGSIPLLFGQVNGTSAQRELEIINSPEITTPWGCRIVSDKDSGYNATGYHEGSVWPLFTGWAALANFRYGDYADGMSLMKKNLMLFDDFGLGYAPEVINGDVLELIGCPHQGWSSSMAVLPVLKGMAGINVDERNRTIDMHPYLPKDWNYLRIRNIRCGDDHFDVNLRREGDGIKFDIEGDTKEYKIQITPLSG
jgi:glycogen debranching enzyme